MHRRLLRKLALVTHRKLLRPTIRAIHYVSDKTACMPPHSELPPEFQTTKTTQQLQSAIQKPQGLEMSTSKQKRNDLEVGPVESGRCSIEVGDARYMLTCVHVMLRRFSNSALTLAYGYCRIGMLCVQRHPLSKRLPLHSPSINN